MPLAFSPIALSMREEYERIVLLSDDVSSDYSFANLYAWAEYFTIELAFEEDVLWIRQTTPHTVYWAPRGRVTGEYLSARNDDVRGKTFCRVPPTLARAMAEAGADVESARDDFDYVYGVRDLIELRGNRYHKKKNHVSQFVKLYDYAYEALTPSAIDKTLAFQEQWMGMQKTIDPSLIAEDRAIHRLCAAWSAFPALKGGLLTVSGAVVAYTIAEPLNGESIVIHFEKGDLRYRGSYQAINKFFLEYSAKEFKEVNREQDLGDEGLRQAKSSYHPARFIEKYCARF